MIESNLAEHGIQTESQEQNSIAGDDLLRIRERNRSKILEQLARDMDIFTIMHSIVRSIEECRAALEREQRLPANLRRKSYLQKRLQPVSEAFRNGLYLLNQ